MSIYAVSFIYAEKCGFTLRVVRAPEPRPLYAVGLSEAQLAEGLANIQKRMAA